jgi:hypothetical protein
MPVLISKRLPLVVKDREHARAELTKEVFEANLELVRRRLVLIRTDEIRTNEQSCFLKLLRRERQVLPRSRAFARRRNQWLWWRESISAH